jgi:hypothetical protein
MRRTELIIDPLSFIVPQILHQISFIPRSNFRLVWSFLRSRWIFSLNTLNEKGYRFKIDCWGCHTRPNDSSRGRLHFLRGACGLRNMNRYHRIAANERRTPLPAHTYCAAAISRVLALGATLVMRAQVPIR